MLVLSVYISAYGAPKFSITDQSCLRNSAHSLRCAPSLSTTMRLSSPNSTTLGIKTHPAPQSAMRGTMMMKTARMPFILASANKSDFSDPAMAALPLPGSADSVTAYCTAVLTARPVTAPSIRIRLRVEVATARSCGLQCAWSATRATAMSARS
jgi:hypothetical protein